MTIIAGKSQLQLKVIDNLKKSRITKCLLIIKRKLSFIESLMLA